MIHLLQTLSQFWPLSWLPAPRNVVISNALNHYLLENAVRDTELLRRLRAETQQLSAAIMQVGPEQGQLLAFLVRLIGAQQTLEIGVFTGYSSLCTALALPESGRVIACDTDEGWTRIAQRYWAEAGVAHKVDLRLAPAQQTLKQLLDEGRAEQFDFAFIDADKTSYDSYYELCLQLIRPGGLIAIDNVLWGGSVTEATPARADTRALKQLNHKIVNDSRVEMCMLTVGDGLTLVQKI